MQTAARRRTDPKNDIYQDSAWQHLNSPICSQHTDSPYDNEGNMPIKNSITVAYTRNSTEEGDPALQRAFIKERANHHGRDLHDVIWFEEGTTSATKKERLQDREEGAKLWELVNDGLVNAVYCYKLDRLFRNISAAHAFVAICQAQGTDIISMDTPEGILDDNGFLLYSINFMMAEMEARRLARRTKDGMAATRKSGKATTGAVFGWNIFDRLDEFGNKDSKVEPAWQEQAVINWMRARIAEGWSQNKVARTLNDIGLRGKKGGKWTSASIGRTLNSKQHSMLSNFKIPKTMMKWPFADLRKKQNIQFD